MANYPFIRRLFHLWFLIRRPLTLGVRVILQDAEGKVLLVRHTYVSGWHLPGGGVEKGESLADAAAKELFEETYHKPTTPIVLQSMHFNRLASNRDHVAVFVCDAYTRVRDFQPNREIAEIGFYNPSALPDGTTEGTKRRITEFLEGKRPSTEW